MPAVPCHSYHGFWLSTFLAKKSPKEVQAVYAEAMKLLKDGVFAPGDGALKFPLEEVVKAVAAAQEPARKGKVLLVTGSS